MERGKGRMVFRNNYKGHMDKTKGGGSRRGRWGGGGVVRVNADKCT